MTSYTFIGWTGSDAFRVLKTHVPDALTDLKLEEQTPTIMESNVEHILQHLKKSKFKSLGITIIGEQSEATYALYIGKMQKNTCAPGDSAILTMPIDITKSHTVYTDLIKDKTIKRTPYPELINFLYVPDETKTSKSSKPPVALDDLEESNIEYSTVASKIARTTPAKVDSEPEAIESGMDETDEELRAKIIELEAKLLAQTEEQSETANPENSETQKSEERKSEEHDSEKTKPKERSKIDKPERKHETVRTSLNQKNVESRTEKMTKSEKQELLDEDLDFGSDESPVTPAKKPTKTKLSGTTVVVPKEETPSDASKSKPKRAVRPRDDDESMWEEL